MNYTSMCAVNCFFRSASSSSKSGSGALGLPSANISDFEGLFFSCTVFTHGMIGMVEYAITAAPKQPETCHPEKICVSTPLSHPRYLRPRTTSVPHHQRLRRPACKFSNFPNNERRQPRPHIGHCPLLGVFSQPVYQAFCC